MSFVVSSVGTKKMLYYAPLYFCWQCFCRQCCLRLQSGMISFGQRHQIYPAVKLILKSCNEGLEYYLTVAADDSVVGLDGERELQAFGSHYRLAHFHSMN